MPVSRSSCVGIVPAKTGLLVLDEWMGTDGLLCVILTVRFGLTRLGRGCKIIT